MATEKATNGVHGKPYPVPLASHDDVVKDPILFMNTLRSFHFSLGSKFLVPMIGGQELNLHGLYVEVTKRGGYDKVVTEKQWSEISTAFDFSPTATSASYALRKHYFTLVYRYELVYFFGLQGSMPDPTGSVSFQAIGTINSKFDCGYTVSVQLGDETLNGVLYHTGPSVPQPSTAIVPFAPQQQQARHTGPSVPQPSTAIVPFAPQQQQARRARKKRASDPGRPKTNRSGYNFFFAEKHATLKSLYPNREREFTKMIGESWNNLSPQEREVYQNYGVKDKERYQEEMKEYNKERSKIGQCSQNAGV